MTSHVTFGLGILSCHLNRFMIHTLLIGDMKIGTSESIEAFSFYLTFKFSSYITNTNDCYACSKTSCKL